MQDSSEIGHCYNALGNTNIILGDYEGAMIAERMSHDYYYGLDDQKEMTYTLSTIGEIYFINGQLDSAEHYLLRALEIKMRVKTRTKLTSL